ncbi:DUF262 domain-containing protein [Psychroserpens sp. S379A]|uniref:DUF262 domain-containing protein n=1 Tax=Psychroserpens sp. S379A TaxID=3415137 RepID=UPI003C7AB02D
MSNNSIGTKLISFEKIIKDHFFKIPDYQRGYSWEKRQLEDLRKDIENLYTKDYRHFTGTIVATKNKEQTNYFNIVDGQQRTTTLIILLNEAAKFLDDFNILNTYIKRGELGREQYVLETNEETKEYFKSLIQKNESPNPKVKSHLRIRDAQLFFKKWFSEKEVDIQKVVDIVTQQFGFIFFTPQDTKEIGIMFEVINNRGKALSELEKIKNFFIYYASIHNYTTFRDEINTIWSEILINLSNAHVYSNNDENSFLRNCYLVFFDTNKTKSWHVYEQLKLRFNPEETERKKIEQDYHTISNFVRFLKDASLHYSYLFNQNIFNESYDKDFKNEISKILTQIRCQPTKASILPLYLATMSYLVENPEGTFKMLQVLEIANFRVYLLPKVTSRADSMQGDMFKWGYNLYHDRNWHSSQFPDFFYTQYSNLKIEGNIIDRIALDVIGFTIHNCSQRKFIQSLTIDDDEADDYYHWKGIRYFLASFEEYKQEDLQTTFDIQNILKQRADATVKNNDFLSLEHIWATQNRSDYFGHHHKEKRRLGNFVLIGLSKNIQLSNDDVPEKVKELNNNDVNKGFGHMALRQVTDLTNILPKAIDFVDKNKHKKRTQNWFMFVSTFINDFRETEMVDFALKRWSFPNETLDNFINVDSFNRQNPNENFILKTR